MKINGFFIIASLSKSIFLLLIFLISNCLTWFPGFQFKSEFEYGESLKISVGQLNSLLTQVPFSYYYLPVCYQNNYTYYSVNLGEILTGDYTYSTHYEILMGKDEYCKVLCSKKIYNQYEKDLFNWMIDRQYTTSWYLDTLPAGLNYTYKNGEFSERVIYDYGIPVGEKLGIDPNYIVYNHYTFLIFLNTNSKNKKPYSIVEFNIIPWSINHDINGTEIITKCAKSYDEFKLRINWQTNNNVLPAVGAEIVYTYDVIFYETSLKWTSRWDHHMFSIKDDNILLFSFITSTMVILIFTSLLGHIFCRVLKRDIDYFNRGAISDDGIDDNSWKQVSNDIFRKPKYSTLLCVLTGTGIQLFSMLLVSLIGGTIGFFSPGNRGSLVSLMLISFVFMGGFAGYWSTRFFKMFRQGGWLKNALLTALFFPSLAFCIFFLINLFLMFENSSGTVSFTTIVTLLLLWLCCSSPLVLIGSFLGIKKKEMKNPGKVNPVPSSIPRQPFYLDLKFISLVSGILPFGAIFIELFYIMSSIWKHHLYSIFSFLLIVLIIMLITSSEISMVVMYFQLSKGDYRWWWKSFFISGSVSFYIFVYSIFYYLNSLQMTRFTSIVIYFGYMFLGSFVIFLVSGSIGFIFTYLFLKKIYSMIKQD